MKCDFHVSVCLQPTNEILGQQIFMCFCKSLGNVFLSALDLYLYLSIRIERLNVEKEGKAQTISTVRILVCSLTHQLTFIWEV